MIIAKQPQRSTYPLGFLFGGAAMKYYLMRSFEYIVDNEWIDDIRYWLAHKTTWGCTLFWNTIDNHPYRFWYQDVPVDLRVTLTNITRMNFKQRVRCLIEILAQGGKL
jgi:hypothetical protein